MKSLPLYRSVYVELRERITGRTYPAGANLPSERKLIEEFGVSLITIRRALDELVLDGLVERRQGVGSFVREQPRDVAVTVSNFTTDVLSGRLRLVRSLLVDFLTPAPEEVADRLGLQPRSQVRHLVRLDCEGGFPLSIDELFVPPALGATLTSEAAASPSFLYLWQAESGIDLARVEFEASVQMPGASDQARLQIGPEVPLLVTAELIHTREGVPAAWVVTRYRSDRTRLQGTFELRQEPGDSG